MCHGEPQGSSGMAERNLPTLTVRVRDLLSPGTPDVEGSSDVDIRAYVREIVLSERQRLVARHSQEPPAAERKTPQRNLGRPCQTTVLRGVTSINLTNASPLDKPQDSRVTDGVGDTSLLWERSRQRTWTTAVRCMVPTKPSCPQTPETTARPGDRIRGRADNLAFWSVPRRSCASPSNLGLSDELAQRCRNTDCCHWHTGPFAQLARCT